MDIKPRVEYDPKVKSGTIDAMPAISIVPCPEPKEDVPNMSLSNDAYTTNDNIPYNNIETLQVTRVKTSMKI